MNKPTDAVLEVVAPARDIDGLPISDGASSNARNVTHAEILDTLRLPRGGPHDATLVAVKRYYDGSGGGEAGHYLMCWVEFRTAGSRWRTPGVKIRPEEMPRVARDMLRGKPSKPGKSEPARVGGKTVATEESELRGALVDGGKGYAIFVRHKLRSGEWGRTRGVEVRLSEVGVLSNLLKQLVETLKEKAP